MFWPSCFDSFELRVRAVKEAHSNHPELFTSLSYSKLNFSQLFILREVIRVIWLVLI
jgi:hypothetical protein